MSDLIQRLDNLFQPFDRSDAPGLVVGVARNGSTLYRRGFGLASVQHGVVNTPATRMRIGSTTKHFTCLAALLLHEQGKLDIDAPVTAMLPEFESPGAVPTLRQFMNHTSGMRCGLELGMLAGGMAAPPKGWQVERLTHQQGANFAPNEGQMYCNGGYHLLSLAIDRAAGQPFEQFLREQVLLPLGMQDTECMPSDQMMLPRVATGHVPAPEGGWRIGMLPGDDIRGEGSLVSTVDDMLRWLRHLDGPRTVGSDALWRQMFETPTLATGLKSIYGLGLNLHDYRGVRVIHHAGGVIGGNSQMLTVPAHGLHIAIMVNGAPCNAIETAFQIVDLVLGDTLGPPRELLPIEGFRHLEGRRYHGASGTLITFGKVKDDRLGLGLDHMPPLPILWRRGDSAVAGFEDLALGPLRFVTSELQAGADGTAPATLQWRESGRAETLQRVDDSSGRVAERGAALVGRFSCADLAAEATLAFEGDELRMQLRADYGTGRRFRIEAYSDTAFSINDIDTPGSGYAMTAEREAGGGVSRFRIDTPRCRHMLFERVA